MHQLKNGLAEGVGFGIGAAVLPGMLFGLEASVALTLGAIGLAGGLVYGATRRAG